MAVGGQALRHAVDQALHRAVGQGQHHIVAQALHLAPGQGLHLALAQGRHLVPGQGRRAEEGDRDPRAEAGGKADGKVVVETAAERETVAEGVLVRVAERRVVDWAVAGRAAGALVSVMGIVRSRSRREW